MRSASRSVLNIQDRYTSTARRRTAINRHLSRDLRFRSIRMKLSTSFRGYLRLPRRVKGKRAALEMPVLAGKHRPSLTPLKVRLLPHHPIKRSLEAEQLECNGGAPGPDLTKSHEVREAQTRQSICDCL